MCYRPIQILRILIPFHLRTFLGALEEFSKLESLEVQVLFKISHLRANYTCHIHAK